MRQAIYCLIGLLLFTACGQVEQNAERKFIDREIHHDNKGSIIFMGNCASCHHLLKDATGPALGGVLQRWGHDTASLIRYIRNPQKFRAEQGMDSYIGKLYKRFGGITMTAFPDISDTDMILLIDYIDSGR